MNRILTQKYFSGKNTVKIAKSLLGKFLVHRRGKKTTAYMITETEAYDGPKDKASHAHRRKTERNKIMFGKAGYWYVYFTYGMHHMLNIVTGPENYPAAILIRSISLHPEQSRRTTTFGTPDDQNIEVPILGSSDVLKLQGPAKLTKYLKIDKKFNGKPANKKTGLWIASGKKEKLSIKSAPRIGVDYAGLAWSRKKYRFFIKIPD